VVEGANAGRRNNLTELALSSLIPGIKQLQEGRNSEEHNCRVDSKRLSNVLLGPAQEA
jgi:hypothetical protein